MKRGRPLVEALENFIQKKPYSLHVPGHKNGHISFLPQQIQQALTYDVTELTGLDDFHQPEEVIEQAEQLLSETYASDRSFFLINGTTVGNLAMIYATCQANDDVLVQRNAHKSVFHALELVGANPIYLTPEWDERTCSAAHIKKCVIEEALKLYPHVRAIVLTYPTYYGVIAAELGEIIELCHTLNIAVLVDEAHGAHFTANEKFPSSALALGADVVVQSAHKTLPAMTMSSFLHVKSTIVDNDAINRYLRMLQSSSPSYLLLASLDDARCYVDTYTEEDFRYLMEERQKWIVSLKSIEQLEVVEVDDPLKLLLRANGYSGFQLKEVLEEQHIYVELADPYQVLMIMPLIKNNDPYLLSDIRTSVKRAINKLKGRAKEALPNLGHHVQTQKMTIPELKFSEIVSCEKECVPYEHASGRIAAEMLIPYPPGIPLFVPGEKITSAKLNELEEWIALGATFQGKHQLNMKQIYVIK